jgi:hypothetical protein
MPHATQQQADLLSFAQLPWREGLRAKQVCQASGTGPFSDLTSCTGGYHTPKANTTATTTSHASHASASRRIWVLIPAGGGGRGGGYRLAPGRLPYAPSPCYPYPWLCGRFSTRIAHESPFRQTQNQTVCSIQTESPVAFPVSGKPKPKTKPHAVCSMQYANRTAYSKYCAN